MRLFERKNEVKKNDGDEEVSFASVSHFCSELKMAQNIWSSSVGMVAVASCIQTLHTFCVRSLVYCLCSLFNQQYVYKTI